MNYTYPAIFMKYKKDELYEIYFPDLNQMTSGKDLNDAMFMARDLLAIVLSSMIEDESQLPTPSKINEIDSDKIIKKLRSDFSEEEKKEYEITEHFVNYVTVDPIEYAKMHITKYDKKTLTIPHWLNVKGQQANVNFSKLLTNALINYFK